MQAGEGCPGAFIYLLLLLLFFLGALAFLSNQDVVQRVWLMNGIYLYPSVWVFSKCVRKYSRAKIKKKNERLIFPLLKYSHETLGSLFISPRHQSGELEARASPHSSDSLYTLKMKSGIKRSENLQWWRRALPFSLSLSPPLRLLFPSVQRATRLRWLISLNALTPLTRETQQM